MTRARSIGMLVVFAGLLAPPAAGAGTGPGTPSLRTIRWAGGQVTQIGSLRTRSSRIRPPTITRAIAAFGAPSSRRLTSKVSCDVSWSALGLRATFVNLGGSRPGQTSCSGSVGLLQVATVRGRGFQTQRGLRVGDSTARLKQLHTGARFRQRSWWLATAPALFGDVEPGERFAIVRAITQDSAVTSFVLQIGAAGE